MRGLGRVYKRGSFWWIAYYHRGHRYRESSHSESDSQARRLLKQRLGEITAGRFIGPSEDRLTFDALVADLENDYKVNDRRSLETVCFHVARLLSDEEKTEDSSLFLWTVFNSSSPRRSACRVCGENRANLTLYRSQKTCLWAVISSIALSIS
jgi:hypothetical protein